MIRTRQSARFPAALPDRASPAKTPRIIDQDGLADLFVMSRATTERLVAKSDIPKMDVSPPGARRRHIWRFDVEEVLAWARGRARKGGAA